MSSTAFCKLLAERLLDEVLDAVGRRVDVVGRQAEMLHEVRLPQAMPADEPGGAPAAVVGHVQLAVADFDAAAAAQHRRAPSGRASRRRPRPRPPPAAGACVASISSTR